MDKEDLVPIHSRILRSNKKILSFDPEGITLSGVSQAEKDKFCVVSLICEEHRQANIFPRQGLYSSHPDDGLEMSSDILCCFLLYFIDFP